TTNHSFGKSYLISQSLGQPSLQGMSERFFVSGSSFFIDLASVLPIMESHGTHDTVLNYLNHDMPLPTVHQDTPDLDSPLASPLSALFPNRM
ncbi:hypothetical protein CROQUDRAFT_653062, partial [Cronartium quercuum f. sp. fusiforme G11]